MRYVIINIFMLLLSATAVLSCSVGMLNEPEMNPGPMEQYITVTGSASDIETGEPIEEVKITLHAAEKFTDDSSFLTYKTTYTDNSGNFSINMGPFMSAASFTISAEDPNGVYENATHEIPLVTWDFDYNISEGTFFVNGCDFHLKKVK